MKWASLFMKIPQTDVSVHNDALKLSVSIFVLILFVWNIIVYFAVGLKWLRGSLYVYLKKSFEIALKTASTLLVAHF